MAKEQGSRNVSEVTNRQMMEELIRIHAQAAGEIHLVHSAGQY